MEKQDSVWRFSMDSDSFRFTNNYDVGDFFCYALNGLRANFIGYTLYLLVTYLIDTAKLIVKLWYSIGALIGYFANRHFTFPYDYRVALRGIHYILVQFIGNLLKVLFADSLGFEHQVIQVLVIGAVRIYFLSLPRFFVFASRAPIDKSNLMEKFRRECGEVFLSQELKALRDLVNDCMFRPRLAFVPRLMTNAIGKVDRQRLRTELAP